jgi:hypothetical protein
MTEQTTLTKNQALSVILQLASQAQIKAADSAVVLQAVAIVQALQDPEAEEQVDEATPQ